jgi:hypothetical protein
VKTAFNQERIMSTPAWLRNAGANLKKAFAGANARRVIISSDARAIAFVFTIIGMFAVVPLLALLGQYLAPNAAKDFQHQSEVLSQAGDQEGAVVASLRAVDIYRGLVLAGKVQYAPKLAASLHDLCIRLHEGGDDAGALVAIREAVEIHRDLNRFGATDAARLEESLQLLTRIDTAKRGDLLRMKTTENTDR